MLVIEDFKAHVTILASMSDSGWTMQYVNLGCTCRSYAKGFGAVGALFAGSECVIEKVNKSALNLIGTLRTASSTSWPLIY